MTIYSHKALASKARLYWTDVEPAPEQLTDKTFLVARVKATTGDASLLYPSQAYSAGYGLNIEAAMQIKDGAAGCYKKIPDWGRLFVCRYNEGNGIHAICPIFVIRGVTNQNWKWVSVAQRAMKNCGRGGENFGECDGYVYYYEETIENGLWSRREVCYPQKDVRCLLAQAGPGAANQAQPYALFREEDPVVVLKTSGNILHITNAAKALFAATF